MQNSNLDDERVIEAILFRSGDAIHRNRLKAYLENPSDLQHILERLSEKYQERGVNLLQSGKYWSFVTAPDLGKRIALVENEPPSRKESNAFSETLAIIAYHQPITRSEISAIRGTECRSDILQRMLSYDWIKTIGRKDTIGRPMLWATSDSFLRHFGLTSLESLPSIDELRKNGLIAEPPKDPAIYDMPSLLPAEDE